MAKRVFYGSTHLAIRPTTYDTAGTPTTGSFMAPQGIQSVGFNTSVAFEPIFQLGQTELYGRTESQSPEVEATISKAFDGTQPLYTTIMGGNTAVNNKQPTELTLNHCELDMGIYSENVPYASGTAESAVYCSGMYLTNVSMTFPIDGMATEEITLLGDTKKHLATSNISAYENVNAGTGTAPAPYQRWSMDVDNSTLPSGVKNYAIQSVSVSMGMGREALQEIGSRGKYCRYPTYPFEVTTDFEVIVGGAMTTRGAEPSAATTSAVDIDSYDFVNDVGLACFSDAKYSIEPGVSPTDNQIDQGYIDTGFRDQTIKLKFCGKTSGDSLSISLGDKCRATSQNYSGGDTGGDNATMSYSFQSYDEFKLDHSGTFSKDPLVVS